MRGLRLRVIPNVPGRASYDKLLRNATWKRRWRQHLDGISVSRESCRLLRARSEANSSAIAISNVMSA